MRTLVYIPGVWDLLHVGHVAILQRARALGDRLVVGVPSDPVVAEDKGELPVIPLADRVKVLESLRCVDVVLPYYRLEFLTHLELIRPDIMVVGETWGTEARHVEAECWLERHGRRLIKLPYSPQESTTAIKTRIKEQSS